MEELDSPQPETITHPPRQLRSHMLVFRFDVE